MEFGNPELPHLEFYSEPWSEARRKRTPFGGPKAPTPQSRRVQAETFIAKLEQMLEGADRLGEAFGIDSNRLRIVEYGSHTLDPEVLLTRKYGVRVVQKRSVSRPDGTVVHQLMVHFPDDESIGKLRDSPQRYRLDQESGLQKQEIELLDAFVDLRQPHVEDRKGIRLTATNIPDRQRIYIDVDLWHPGVEAEAEQLVSALAAFCLLGGGSLESRLVTSSMILAKLSIPPSLIDRLLEFPWIAQVELPPELEKPFDRIIMSNAFEDPILPLPPENPPLAAVLDSGVVAGHPLLRGWVVAEQSFIEPQDRYVDDHGHGTAVASLVIHGDIHDSLVSNRWNPTVAILSGRLLERHPWIDEVNFPEKVRIEIAFQEAIRHFHREYGCRVFCIATAEKGEGSSNEPARSQLPWAHVLDELIRELDIVIVVASGNCEPTLPEQATNSIELQKLVADSTIAPEKRVNDPGAAALSITVGAVSRNEAVGPTSPDKGRLIPDALRSLSTKYALAAFSRTGPGYPRKESAGKGIKPDVVTFGGNVALRANHMGGGPSLDSNPSIMGEPVARLEFASGRFVVGRAGTSMAAPRIANHAARLERTLEQCMSEGTPSANLIRAFIGISSSVDCLDLEQCSNLTDQLKRFGHGMVTGYPLLASHRNDVFVFSEGVVEVDRMQMFHVDIPEEFLA